MILSPQFLDGGYLKNPLSIFQGFMLALVKLNI